MDGGVARPTPSQITVVAHRKIPVYRPAEDRVTVSNPGSTSPRPPPILASAPKRFGWQPKALRSRDSTHSLTVLGSSAVLRSMGPAHGRWLSASGNAPNTPRDQVPT